MSHYEGIAIPNCMDQAPCLRSEITLLDCDEPCLFEVCIYYAPDADGCTKDTMDEIDHICTRPGSTTEICQAGQDGFCCKNCEENLWTAPPAICQDTRIGYMDTCGGTIECRIIRPNTRFTFGVKDGSGGCTVPYPGYLDDDLGNSLGLNWRCEQPNKEEPNEGSICDGNSNEECEWSIIIPEHQCKDRTKSPTTKAPTTKSPTTKAPTTKSPTTKAPTTNSPTTKAPTTKSPTTNAPTTKAPTTKAPTTKAPTTKAPTTKAPTTKSPTTKTPTTKAPTTKAPTTAEPTTSDPTCTDPHAISDCNDQSLCFRSEITPLDCDECLFEVCIFYEPDNIRCPKDRMEAIDSICTIRGGTTKICQQNSEFCCKDCLSAKDNPFDPPRLCHDTMIGNNYTCGGAIECRIIGPNIPFTFGVKDGDSGCKGRSHHDLGNQLGLNWLCKKPNVGGIYEGNVCNGGSKKECEWSITIPEDQCITPEPTTYEPTTSEPTTAEPTPCDDDTDPLPGDGVSNCVQQAPCFRAKIHQKSANRCMYELCLTYTPEHAQCTKSITEALDYICIEKGGLKRTCSAKQEAFCCKDCDNTGSIHVTQGLCRDTGIGLLNTEICGGNIVCIDIPYNKEFVFGVKDGNGDCNKQPYLTDLGSGFKDIFKCEKPNQGRPDKEGNVCNGHNKQECQWSVMIPKKECPPIMPFMPKYGGHRSLLDTQNITNSDHFSLPLLGIIAFIIIISWCYCRKRVKDQGTM